MFATQKSHIVKVCFSTRKNSESMANSTKLSLNFDLVGILVRNYFLESESICGRIQSTKLIPNFKFHRVGLVFYLRRSNLIIENPRPEPEWSAPFKEQIIRAK